mmetsp:Transcript_110847/g.201382  ORF Transcript_110847/g.201382 Transcript_110847/m.201382 type:complete len:257 (+) Transcript_110847:1205-1975(+)
MRLLPKLGNVASFLVLESQILWTRSSAQGIALPIPKLRNLAWLQVVGSQILLTQRILRSTGFWILLMLRTARSTFHPSLHQMGLWMLWLQKSVQLQPCSGKFIGLRLLMPWIPSVWLDPQVLSKARILAFLKILCNMASWIPLMLRNVHCIFLPIIPWMLRNVQSTFRLIVCKMGSGMIWMLRSCKLNGLSILSRIWAWKLFVQALPNLSMVSFLRILCNMGSWILWMLKSVQCNFRLILCQISSRMLWNQQNLRH